MTTYFAYGANIDAHHMAERCPHATRLALAFLADHSFGIAATGYGTVRSDPGSAVPGILWSLTEEDERALDAFEGVPEGLYRKSTKKITTYDLTTVEAMIYLPTDDSPGHAVPGYVERIMEVGKTLGFSRHYLAGLKAHSAS